MAQFLISNSYSYSGLSPLSLNTLIPRCSSFFGSINDCSDNAARQQIDFQSNFGRGHDHLSAFVNEGDVVVYQSGTWYVDGVEVGDGSPPTFHYCRVETLQIVWTHNCEHGVIRGFPLEPVGREQQQKEQEEDTSVYLKFVVDLEDPVEFGPEQLVARLSGIQWDEMDKNQQQLVATFTVPILDEMWITE